MEEKMRLSNAEIDTKIFELRTALNGCVGAKMSLSGRDALNISQELDRYIVLASKVS